MKLSKTFAVLLFCFSLTIPSFSQYRPTEEIIKAQQRFRDNKFGIFIHWGIYSLLGHGEWVMNNRDIDYREYPKLASAFYPHRFNADEWVDAVKASGARYITVTTRHHDGFSMFDTRQSDYNIVKATPFGRDVMKELSEACRRKGIALHFYYSHLDWYRTDYPLGRTGKKLGRPTDGINWKGYYAFMNAQLRELLTNYGPIGAIWFDGWWDHDEDPQPFDWQLDEQYAMIHSLQPSCLVINNHHQAPNEGEDVQVFERDLPGENKAGLSGQAIGRLPLETCETMNRTWGYSITDTQYKSTDDLIRLLVKAAGLDANLLLNVGPEPNGSFPAEAVRRLHEMGQWMNRYGATIHDTRGGMVPPRDWGVTTQRGKTLFVHILNLPDNGLFLPIEKKLVKKAVDFIRRTDIKIVPARNGILLELPEHKSEVDFVVEVTLA